MNKREFLEELKRLASALPEGEREKLLEYYAEMIDDRMEEGIAEEAAVAALGDPLSLAEGLRPEAPAEADGATFPALNGLRLRVTGADVRIRREALANGAAAQLRFSDPARFTWRMDGDTLEITQPEADAPRFSLRWLQQMVAAPAQRVTVALSDALSGALDVEGGGGDLSVEGAAFARARLATASGDIELKRVDCGGDIELRTHGGDVKLNGVRAGGLTVRAASGDISARELSLGGRLGLETASGDVELRDVACAAMAVASASGDIEIDRCRSEEASVTATSGDVELNALECDPSLTVQTTSGDIDAIRCIARRARLTAASGDITLRLEPLPCGYAISARSASGSVRLPSDNPPAPADAPRPELTLQTVSGDIEAEMLGD